MILPSKHLKPDRALLTVGADILLFLNKRPCTVSKLWDDLREQQSQKNDETKITFDWFILALYLLYILGAITFEDGILKRVNP